MAGGREFEWVSAGRVHPARYDALVDAVNECGTGFWDGPTSFIAIRSTLSLEALGAKLSATISRDDDLIVLREIGKDNTGYAGVPGDGFESFFPNAKKL